MCSLECAGYRVEICLAWECKVQVSLRSGDLDRWLKIFMVGVIVKVYILTYLCWNAFPLIGYYFILC